MRRYVSGAWKIGGVWCSCGRQGAVYGESTSLKNNISVFNARYFYCTHRTEADTGYCSEMMENDGTYSQKRNRRYDRTG